MKIFQKTLNYKTSIKKIIKSMSTVASTPRGELSILVIIISNDILEPKAMVSAAEINHTYSYISEKDDQNML